MLRILVIEDDPEAASYLVKGLSELGHTADHAADGQSGLEMALHSSYDILIVDRMLPRLDGLSIIQELRQEENHTPVLILSALGQVDDRVLPDLGIDEPGEELREEPLQQACLTESIVLVDGAAQLGARGGRIGHGWVVFFFLLSVNGASAAM